MKIYNLIRCFSGVGTITVVARTVTRESMHILDDFSNSEILNNEVDRSKLLDGVFTDVVNDVWDGINGSFGLSENATVSDESKCGKILPYKETYLGTLEYITGWKCYVRIGDDNKTFTYKLSLDINGDYIKINDLSGKQIRFIPKTFESVCTEPTTFLDVSLPELYQLKQCIEPALINELVSWVMVNDGYYIKELIDDDYIEPQQG